MQKSHVKQTKIPPQTGLYSSHLMGHSILLKIFLICLFVLIKVFPVMFTCLPENTTRISERNDICSNPCVFPNMYVFIVLKSSFAQCRIDGMICRCNCNFPNFEKARKTEKNKENPRKSRVFCLISFKRLILGCYGLKRYRLFIANRGSSEFSRHKAHLCLILQGFFYFFFFFTNLCLCFIQFSQTITQPLFRVRRNLVFPGRLINFLIDRSSY